MSLFSFVDQTRAYRRFTKLDPEQRRVVFYAEDGGAWPHFEAMVRELTEVRGRDVCYLTSSADDPVLGSDHPRLHAFDIGAGTVRTTAFSGLETDIVVMTMPELERHYIKRSKTAPVHYAYVFHSIVSTHMIYRPGAFDHYDAVFCVGPHHVREIRANEKASGLPEKTLVEHGYNRLETIIEERDGGGPEAVTDGRYVVLIAPSWGENGILERLAQPLVAALLDAGLHVIVRPHPMTDKNDPRILAELRRRFDGDERFEIDLNISGAASLHRSHVMLSDWSGAALEYAFGLERPVLFLDMPRKVNNPDYEQLEIEPLEVWVRDEIGKVIDPDHLERCAPAIAELCADPQAFAEQIRAVRERAVFNLGSSGVVAAEYIEKVLATKSREKGGR